MGAQGGGTREKAAEGDGRRQEAVDGSGSREELAEVNEEGGHSEKIPEGERVRWVSKPPTLRVYKEGCPPSFRIAFLLLLPSSSLLNRSKSRSTSQAA